MNTSAERHLSKAADYVAKGEEFYRKAADEIVAAQEADPTLTQPEIAERIGKGELYVSRLLRARREGGPVNWGSGSNRRDDVAVKFLNDAPLEQVEQIIAELPPERQQDVAAAAGHAYMKARQTYRESERDLTPAKRKEREAAGEAMTRPAVSAVASFTIISRLEVALEELRELNAASEVPAQLIEPLTKLIGEFVDELRVTRAMAGLDIDLDEVRS